MLQTLTGKNPLCAIGQISAYLIYQNWLVLTNEKHLKYLPKSYKYKYTQKKGKGTFFFGGGGGQFRLF